MNLKHFIAVFTFIVAVAVSTAFAQGSGTQPRPQSPPAQSTTVAVPVSKIAVIYSEAFQDPKAGIVRFTALLNNLNREFQPRQTELNQTAQQIKQLEDEIAKAQNQVGPPIDQRTLQAKIEQHDQMKKVYTRKGEDAQAAYQKRRQELFGPLQDDVGKALDVYAKAHGITMILDGSQVQGILFAADSVDITRQFIIEYNSKNPATAVVTTPK